MSGSRTETPLTQAPEFRLAIIAVAVFILMAALAPDRFLSAQNLTSMAFQFPEFAILALAMTITMTTGGIDLSVVGVSNLSAVIAATILTSLAGPDATGMVAFMWLAVAVAASLTVGATAGLCNGVLVSRLGMPPILATLGSGLVFTGFAVAMTGGSAVMGFPDMVAVIGNSTIWVIPVPLILFVVLAFGLHILLTRTGFGLRITMYGANPLGALYAAINIDRILIRVYVIAGMFSSVAGLIIMSRANSAKADYGSSFLLLAVLIAVLGGGQSLWRIWPGDWRRLGSPVDAISVVRSEHAGRLKLCTRTDLGSAVAPRDGDQHNQLVQLQSGPKAGKDRLTGRSVR